ncbi:radical SAM protein [Massilia sp. TSP1-1-2]|uniref:radical SAM protein n=1 Tax=unclassified Massilia TaxID=2609279 RepID=UPI003CF6E9DB
MDTSGAPAVIAANATSLYIVLKVTERCNLACPYCYFFFAGDDTFKIHPATILGDTIDGLIEFVGEAIDNSAVQQVNIGFHGGEPLLLRKETFRGMCTRLEEALAHRCKLQFMMQTNAVLVDPEWVELFVRYQIQMGVSFDGPEEIHNLTRITKKGRGTYTETRRGWDVMNAAGNEGRMPNPGVLCVIAPGQSARKTYAHFVNDLATTNINFLMPDVNHDSPEATAAFIDAVGDYMIEICHAWLTDGARRGVEIRFIKEIIGPLLDDQVCRASALGKYNPFVLMTVSSNGDIAPDDIVRTLAPRFRETGFQVGRNTLPELAASSQWQELARAQRQLPQPCQSCVWRSVCRGGAPQNRFSGARGFDNPSVYCKSLKRVYAYLADSLIKGGIGADAMEQRLEMAYE